MPPRGIGPIAEPNENDVLCGRGGRINAHEGNVQFRDIVMANKKEYLAKTTKKLEKQHIAARVVEFIRTLDPPGRFLKEDSDTGLWYDVGDAKAIKKAGQALREDAPDIRGESGDDDDDDDGDQATPSTKKSATEVSPKRARSPPASTKKPVPTAASSATAAPAARVPTTATAPAPRAPVSGRGPIQHHLSWHSSGSSTFGMPLPQQGPSMPSQGYPPQPTPAYSSAGSGVSMPATHSSGSAQHLLKPAGTLLNPAQLYQGMRNVSNRATGTLSKRAAEIMQFQNLQAQAQAHRQAHPGMRYPSGQPEEVAFGRNFTPTDLSSGSTMSTISDTSGFSNPASNLTGSALGGAAPSALSLGSSGMGPPATAGRGPRVPSSTQTMTSFMSSAGLSRSLSFGDSDVYSVGNTPMSDASFIALLAEDKAIGDILSTLPPLVSSNTSSKSSSDQFNSAFASSAMSVTSSGSNKSMMNVSTRSAASENSWLHPYQRSHPKEQFDAMWPDDRSMISDVSERILALDLALPSQM